LLGVSVFTSDIVFVSVAEVSFFSVCVIWGGLPATEKVNCPPDNVIYIVDEAYAERRYNQKFLNQFPTIISCREDLGH